MNDVKILRLQDSTDIIGFVTELENGSYYIINPMQIIIHVEGKYSGIILREWLPARLIELNEATIDRKQVVCVLGPNTLFIDYYIKFTVDIKNKLDSLSSDLDIKESDTDDYIEEFNNLTREEDQPLH